MTAPPAEESTKTEKYDFVPAQVLGRGKYSAEPQWGRLPQMPYSELVRGIR